jgi:8-oxo-dGTP pyrophosphatase MutT (NUDIX family)
MVRRPEKGMLGGMWEYPGRVVDPGELPAQAASRAASALAPGATRTRSLAAVPHAYSHRHHVYHAFLFDTDHETDPDLDAVSGGGWTATAWERPDPAGRALPAAQRKIARALAALSPC